MARKRKPVINAKRAKLLKEIQKQVKQGRTPNVAEAGRAAGFGTYQAAHQSLKRIGIDLPSMLEKAGLGVETILRGFKESEQATETRFFQHNGIVMDQREVVANDIRLRARTEVAKFHNLYPRGTDEGLDKTPANQIFNIVVGLGDASREIDLIEAARKRVGVGDLGQPSMDVEVDEDSR